MGSDVEELEISRGGSWGSRPWGLVKSHAERERDVDRERERDYVSWRSPHSKPRPAADWLLGKGTCQRYDNIYIYIYIV